MHPEAVAWLLTADVGKRRGREGEKDEIYVKGARKHHDT